jgi:hypothetical protein
MPKHYSRVKVESAFVDDIKPMIVGTDRVSFEIDGMQYAGGERISLEVEIAAIQREHVVAVFGLTDSPIDIAFTDELMELANKHNLTKALITRIK